MVLAWNRVKRCCCPGPDVRHRAMPEPAPASLPDQETVKLGVVVVEGMVVTVLVGVVVSIVLTICGVAMAALVSNTMLAWASSERRW